MGYKTRLEVLLASMKEDTRNSMYVIEDTLSNISECSTIDVYFNDNGSIESINKKNKLECKQGRCDILIWSLDILLMICLCFTGIGIVLAIQMYDKPNLYLHVNLNLYYNSKNRDSVRRLFRYFNIYYQSKYTLSVSIS